MKGIIDFVYSIVWSNALVVLCLGLGLYFTVKMRFPQIRHFREMIRLLMSGSSSEKGVSSFQALSVSLSGRVGTGNIAGVATAIFYGGPGAIFWMWCIAFLGAGSAYVESALGQIYKVEQNGEYRGGPAYYIEKGLQMKGYAVAFALVSMMALGLFLPGVQSNAIASSMSNALDISTYISGIILVIVIGAIIFGGIKRIAKTAEFIVPFMALAYILLALIIIIMNIQQLPAIIKLIFTSAFGVNQVFGGVLGMAIKWGVQRGIYSNEAGQGTGPHAAAAAEVDHPAVQGLVQAFSVYIDTLFVCSATAFMILITGAYNVNGIVENLPGVEAGPQFTQAAVNSAIPGFGDVFVAIALFFFAMTTILAYYYMAETNLSYLTKKINDKHHKNVLIVLKVCFLASVFYGVTTTAAAAWQLGDIGVGLMAWLNLVAIFLLRKPAFESLRDYEQQKKEGINPTYNSKKMGVEHAEFWDK